MGLLDDGFTRQDGRALCVCMRGGRELAEQERATWAFLLTDVPFALPEFRYVDRLALCIGSGSHIYTVFLVGPLSEKIN